MKDPEFYFLNEEDKLPSDFDKNLFFSEKDNNAADEKIRLIQNEIRVIWKNFFSSIEIVLVLIALNGGLLSLINNNCVETLISASAAGLFLLGMQIFFTTMMIVSHIDFTLKIIFKFFVMFFIGWFSTIEILGYYSINFTEFSASCNPPLMWGSDSNLGFLFLISMIGGAIYFCFQGNYDQ